jgi:NAD(P)-dependent dehydrogenase (short-subunit alcohol dehydrogenase family)
MQFTDKVIAVTGGASGIGLETARQLLSRGSSVAIFDLNAQELEQSMRSLVQYGDRVFAAVADAANLKSMTRGIDQAIGKLGRLDGLVANAGIRMRSVPFTELDEDIWDQIIRVNLRGVFITCRAAAPHMIAARAGSIVTVASISGQVARLDQSAYCASKAGVIQLSRALALELAQHNIRVNAICPGTVNTAMFQNALVQDGEKIMHDRVHGSATRFRSGIPLRRIAEVDDPANSILFFLSDAARHITGQALFVDGGESIV